MTLLWLRMSEIYGAQFANQYGEVGGESFQTWGLALRDFTPADIKHGFNKLLAREKTFVPNLNEFKSLCQKSPEDLGLPTTAMAWVEASSNSHDVKIVEILGGESRKWKTTSSRKWKCSAVYEAGRRCGFTAIKQGKISEKQFSKVYREVCDEVMRGTSFDTPIYEIENRLTVDVKKTGHTKTEENKAANVSHISALRALL